MDGKGREDQGTLHDLPKKSNPDKFESSAKELLGCRFGMKSEERHSQCLGAYNPIDQD
jgi:hypothetical protein